MAGSQELYIRIQHWTEQKLTKRKQKRIRKRKNRKKKNQIREWIEALLWAVVVVFLINQFVFQLYAIPSPSMEDTLLVKDRVFVNKFTYGPEIYPGGPKILSSFNQPERNEIIVFKNPTYVSRGTAFDILTKIVYMLTFSAINLDRDDNGEDRAQLYVKRAVGMPGDVISFNEGDIFIKPEGFIEKIPEDEFRMLAGFDIPMKRQILEEDYTAFSADAVFSAYELEGIQPPKLVRPPIMNPNIFIDKYHYTKTYYETLCKNDPADNRYRSLFAMYTNGYYIPDNYLLPIGDNRDNSMDGRYFGVVEFDDVLGRTIFKFWPLSRFGIAK